MSGSAGAWGRFGGRGRWTVAAIVGVTVLMLLPAGIGLAPTGLATATISAVSAGGHIALSGNNSSGRGSFYQSQVMPKAALSQHACYNGTCVNATTDPSMNLTATGVLAVAYTSYSDVAACGTTFSEIAVVTSSDGGQTWSSPTYLNNPQCGVSQNNDSQYDNSWEPSLTSLPNGTLVLAYVQYTVLNSIAPDLEWINDPYRSLSSYNVPYDRLVVTESYNGGTTWTTPTIVNASNNPSLTPGEFWSPLRPSITSFGETVYVTWTSVGEVLWPDWTIPNYPPIGAMNVSLSISTDGGRSWSPAANLATMQGPSTYGEGSVPAALNPAPIVLPDGQLTIAYLGNVTGYGPSDSFCDPGFCQSDGPDPGAWAFEGGEIVVARSMNNGTTFNYSVVPDDPANEPLWIVNAAAGADLGFSHHGGAGGWGGQGGYDAMYPLVNPAPAFAYDLASGQLFLAYEAGNMTQVSGWYQTTTVFVTNSSSAGAQWSTPRQVDPSLIQPEATAGGGACAYELEYGCYSQAEGQAALTIYNGSLIVAFGYYDYNACGTDSAGTTECGMVEELVYSSANDGATFAPDGIASTVLTVDDALYAGASASAIGTGSRLWIAWTQPWCPDWTTAVCEWPQAAPDGPQVLVSQPYTGTGLTVQFQESGLPSWLNWNLTIGGNLLQGAAGTPLSLSGIPPSTPVGWYIPPVTGPYGSQFTATTSPPSPGSFTSSATVLVTFAPAFTSNVTVQFQQSGLPSGLNWSISFGGVLQSGTTSTALVFAGVPANNPITWEVPNGGSMNSTQYGVRYTATSSSVPSPTAFATDTTVTVTYTPQYLLNVESSPFYPIWSQSVCNYEGNGYPNPTGPFCWDDPNDANFNYDLTGTIGSSAQPLTLGSNWVTLGTPVTAEVTPQTGFCNYGGGYGDTCEEANLSFEGWAGTGAGSVTGSGSSITINVQGPVNETALFEFVGVCVVTGTPGTPILYQCSGLNYTLSFVESGLPTGTEWGVTTASAVENSVASNESTTSSLNVTAVSNSGIVTYRAWSVPAAGGEMWIPNRTVPGSPVELPGQAVVQVNYTLQDPNGTSYLTEIRSSGLPSWVPGYSMTVGGTNYGVQGTTTNRTLEGGTYAFGASPVYLSNGTGYYLRSITVEPNVANWSTVTLPADPTGSTLIAGPAIVTLNFGNLSYVNLEGSEGGSINATSQWVELGQRLELGATAVSNYTFVQWTGSGPGSVSATSPTIQVTPNGPVTEVATFEHVPPTTYVATVSVAGLPTGTAATVEIGGQAYTSVNGTFGIGGLNGTYVFAVPVVYADANNLTRYAPVNVTTTFPVTAGLITVTGPGTIEVTYEAQYGVTLMSTGPGTIGPETGTVWENRSTGLTLTATPGAGAELVGWIGSGNGSVTATTPSITVTVTAPITETAMFVPEPPAIPRYYELSVTETGLPEGTSWSFSLGSEGGAGTAGTLELGRLNGSYTLVVPTVYEGAGTRYVANLSSETVVLTGGNASVSVQFTTEYGVTVASSTGGEATASVAGWVGSGEPVTFTATAESGWEFAGWTGTGPGSTNGSSGSVTVTVSGGAVTEKALFVPEPVLRPPATTSPSATNGLPLDVGLLAGLLVAGMVVAFVLSRSGGSRSSPARSESMTEEETEEDGSPPETEAE